MGLIDFIKGAGEKIFGKDEDAGPTMAEVADDALIGPAITGSLCKCERGTPPKRTARS